MYFRYVRLIQFRRLIHSSNNAVHNRRLADEIRVHDDERMMVESYNNRENMQEEDERMKQTQYATRATTGYSFTCYIFRS